MSQIEHVRSNTTDTVENPQRDPLFCSLATYKVKCQPVKVVSTSSANGLEHHRVLVPRCIVLGGRSKGRSFTGTRRRGFQSSSSPHCASPGPHSLIPTGDQRGNGWYFYSLFQRSDLPHLHVKKMFSSKIKCLPFSYSSLNAWHSCFPYL